MKFVYVLGLSLLISGCSGISKNIVAMKNVKMDCGDVTLSKLVKKSMKDVEWSEELREDGSIISFQGTLHQEDSVKVAFLVNETSYQLQSMHINDVEENAFSFDIFMDDLCTYYNE